MIITDEIIKWPKTLFDDTEPREEGIHLSDVIKFIKNKTGMVKGVSGAIFSDLELTAEIGLLWEEALSKIMANKYAIRPGQIYRDGVWMSLDGIGPDPLGEVPLVVEEYKCTWQSIRRSVGDNFSYMTQVKSYCYAVDTNVAIMRVFYLMGDYKGSGPIYRVSRVVFDDVELRQNWNMIMNFLKDMKIEG